MAGPLDVSIRRDRDRSLVAQLRGDPARQACPPASELRRRSRPGVLVPRVLRRGARWHHPGADARVREGARPGAGPAAPTQGGARGTAATAADGGERLTLQATAARSRQRGILPARVRKLT